MDLGFWIEGMTCGVHMPLGLVLDLGFQMVADLWGRLSETRVEERPHMEERKSEEMGSGLGLRVLEYQRPWATVGWRVR